ncbi:MAG: hypothetical protein M4579_005555 [Chaenotheca gracillima]|nr:MAG: hypothetical protein M4579_005555 [Chaenotheca gracillima]
MARKYYNVNARTVAAPLTAFIMAGLLYVYSRTSIRAAKTNAQRHREADGGQISWHNETLRRHGVMERPPEDGLLTRPRKGATGDAEKKEGSDVKDKNGKTSQGEGVESEEAKLRRLMGKRL